MSSFSKQTIAFLMENHFRNSREWYQEHKSDYIRYVLEPFQQFVSDLSPTILDIDSKLVTEPKVDKTISRIYRDTRFSRDKTLYRENVWCVFSRDKKLYHGPPALYFELSPDNFSYGCGYYQASTQEMQALRDMVLENGKLFPAAKKAYESQSVFHMIGDRYKRNRYPDQPPELQEWLNRRSISFTCTSVDFDLAFSSEFAHHIAKDLTALKPIYNFLLAVHSRAREH